ncbi:MAG: putative selenium-dependent hydroxylase accessory protein YqeC [Anaerolineae bacterium]|nr:putative selenium-dependent hydroxylase accessory protein YqeC [Anaerolineae bacterium]
MRLHEALNVQRGDVVAFTGAGGKTSAMVRLGRELATQDLRVLATTTTRIATSELEQFPHTVHWQSNLLQGKRELATLLDKKRLVFVYQEIRGDKVIGLPSESISRLVDEMNADLLLVEADGSRRLPLKAPRLHEPVIPQDTTLLVPVAGLDALGMPFDETTVYNPEPIFERYGFPLGQPIQPAWLAQIVRDEQIGLKALPPTARVVVLLNKAGEGLSRGRARRIAQIILASPKINAVAIGAMQAKNPVFEVQRRVGVIILAAGLSSRMGGHPKALLKWGRHTVIETIVNTLVPFRLPEIVVVTGYKSGQVASTLQNSPVKIAFNPQFKVGEMLSSLQVGLKTMSSDIDACMVMMGDQPQIRAKLIRQILNLYAEGKGSIIAPMYQGQRGHPILIQRRHWPDILDLPFGSAPRDAINRNPVYTFPVDNDSILRDIDTPEQYAAEKRLAGLE